MIRKSGLWLSAGASLALFAGPVCGDVWDTGSPQDDSAVTDNQLIHGAVQVHDLESQGGVRDQDWYMLGSKPYSSYEVLVDGMQGEVWQGVLPLDLVTIDGTLLVSARWAGQLGAMSLRWENAATYQDDYVRVLGTGTSCGTTCTSNAQYTIRMWETTLSIPRFNNSGTQMTVLLLQNPSTYTIAGHIYVWANAGTLIASQAFSADAKELLVVNTSSLAPGASGSITITHDGRYGDLAAKTVALEPETGFAFDTPAFWKPH